MIVVVGCGSRSSYGSVPLGWRGSLPWCKQAVVASGTALRKLDTGFFEAVAAGGATLRCADGSEAELGVESVHRLTIEGPAVIAVEDRPFYSVHAFGDGGAELTFADPYPDVVDWRVSPGSAEIRGGYCHEPIFGCPGVNHARLSVAGPGSVVISVSVAAAQTSLRVTAK